MIIYIIVCRAKEPLCIGALKIFVISIIKSCCLIRLFVIDKQMHFHATVILAWIIQGCFCFWQ